MKKLLSILGTITLVGTVAPNVVACHNKKNLSNESITAKDIKVFNRLLALLVKNCKYL
ncbi:lipoprotein [Spiroplasma poulsonii]|uniref:lipoprotein n=1 Tax=Spiroplasma poulsonii TaxID=2138 RepID=UPI0013313292|nr:lipoprotein [Spiroplasma poulsonii]KAF0849867.1 putative lipoprotein [Spiroplasma poulsonii]